MEQNKNTYMDILCGSPLFAGFCKEEIASALNCLAAQKRLYEKNSFIFQAGEPVSHVGLLLSGQVQVYREDVSGNRTILAVLSPGHLFAEAFVCSHTKTLPVTVFSVTESVVLFIDYSRIIGGCPAACEFHSPIIRNMMAILADKNILLSRKIEHLSQRSTREKLLSFLQEQAEKEGSRTFQIPYSRQALADYLCVERSAMSAALSAMQRDGLLQYNRSHFTLL